MKNGTRAGVLIGLTLALVISAGATGVQAEAVTANQPMIGKQAPGFELKGISGETLSLDDLKGKFVVIHFGASW